MHGSGNSKIVDRGVQNVCDFHLLHPVHILIKPVLSERAELKKVKQVWITLAQPLHQARHGDSR